MKIWKILLVCCFVASLAQADLLTGPRNKFEVQRADIERKFSGTRDQAGQQYVRMLKALIQHMEKTGDEFGVKPVQAEITRFTAERMVPETPPPGTPELLAKSQGKYLEAMKKIDVQVTAETDKLVSKYLTSLNAVRQKLKSGGRLADADLVLKEIERVQSVGSGDARPAASLRLPPDAAKSLVLAYDFEEKEDRKVRDLSGRRRHGDLLAAEEMRDSAEGAAYKFLSDDAMLEIEPLNLGNAWTLIVRCEFPLKKKNEVCVLASNGYRQHHLMVDAAGELCLTADRPSGSGFFVNDLKGWHEIAIVTGYTKSLFYVNGKLVGTVPAVVKKPLKTIGNSGASGRPWSGAISSVLLFRSTFSNELMARLFESR